MRLEETVRLSFGVVRAQKLRAGLSILGIAIGIAAVILLTSIGEGTRQYVLDQFTQFGTNILAVFPGKTKTVGIPGALGGTTHKLTIGDAEAIERVPGVTQVLPVALGQARVEAEGRGRSVYINGVTSEAPNLWKFGVRQGRFLPRGDPRRGAQVAVLGPKLKQELFGEKNALGAFVDIAGVRFRVIGIMEPKGQMMGFDIDDAAYIPVATAMKLFNMEELMEIDVTFRHADMTESVSEGIRQVLLDRHDGNEDFTIVTQTAMLDVFDNVMSIITTSVGAIAAISLVVGAIGILTMMWIAVGERTGEIGLMRAIGATRSQILFLFLAESVLLALVGGAIGIATGMGFAGLLRWFVPGLPIRTPFGYVAIALGVSFATGLLSGVLPARRAANLDPIEALRAE